MSVTEHLVLFWLIPSLTMILVFAAIGRCNSNPIEGWNWRDEALPLLFCSIIYPFGLLALLVSSSTWSTLIKERKWWWQK